MAIFRGPRRYAVYWVKRELYIGDNLDILRRYIPPESIDLVYLDPPFKSDRQYNMLFTRRAGARAAAQARAFEDTWEWNAAADHACQLMTQMPGKLGESIAALYRLLGEVPMMAYIAMMAPRLVELRKVLKPKGSIYLHCDSTASHYLKILMDAIFGPARFLNEIAWRRTNARSTTGQWPRIHDTLLLYAKNEAFTFHALRVPGDRAKLPHTLITAADGKKYQTYELTGPGLTSGGDSGKPWRGHNPSEMGRHWGNSHAMMDSWDAEGLIHWPKEGGFPRRRADKPFDADSRLVVVGDVWTDIDRLNQTAKERVGFPTQKPNALLRRLIEASSNPGDVVLDPFCGCGTAIVVAEQLKRQWIGIDITDVALDVIAHRLAEIGPVPYIVRAIEPRALPEAIALARKDRKEFETWALGLVGARPETPHRGADRGVDARFLDTHGRPVVVSVKSGKVTASQVRDLRGVVDREGAVVGAFITLYQPTKAMLREAATAGAYSSPAGLVSRIQILTIAQLLDPDSRRLLYPASDAVLAQPATDNRKGPDQFRLPLVTTVAGGRHSHLPKQEVPTAAPPSYAAKLGRLSRPGPNRQLGMEQVEQAVPWHLARQPLSKAPSRRRTGRRRQRRAS